MSGANPKPTAGNASGTTGLHEVLENSPAYFRKYGEQAFVDL